MTLFWCVVAVAAILFLATLLVPGRSAGIRARAARPRSRNVGARPMPSSARWLEAECATLVSADAPWEEVIASLNAGHDVEIATLLARIRASHAREPRAGLTAIRDGCRLANEQNDMASAFDALAATVRSLPPLPVVHWESLAPGHEQ